MSTTDVGSEWDALSVLLVEDEPDAASMIDRTLQQSRVVDVRVTHATTLAETLERIRDDGHLDAILLDLGLPDAAGVTVVRRVVDAVVDAGAATAVVVLTGLDDERLAMSSLELGVQDYIVKDSFVPELITRVLRYSVARSRLQAELAEARHAADRERELRRLERLAGQSDTTSVSAALMGQRPTSERLRAGYDEVVGEYRRLAIAALDETVYRASAEYQEDLRALAAVLGFAGAGPRDVVKLHTAVMRQLTDGAADPRAEAMLEEGRLLALELMGRLVVYYRARAIASGPADDGRRA